MMKNSIAVLILLMSGSVFAETPAQGPDRLYFQCVETSDRATFRVMRNLCDDEATERGYSVGIFRPNIESQDGGVVACLAEPEHKPFTCLGAPHQETVCIPPCEPG